jgi:hypothetical protein
MASRRLQNYDIEIDSDGCSEDKGRGNRIGGGRSTAKNIKFIIIPSTNIITTTRTQPTTYHRELHFQVGNTRGVHKFTGGPSGMKCNEAPEVIKLLVVETN